MPKAPEAKPETVSVRITKFGDGKVSTGTYTPANGDIYAAKGDVLEVSPSIADELEKRALAEIVD